MLPSVERAQPVGAAGGQACALCQAQRRSLCSGRSCGWSRCCRETQAQPFWGNINLTPGVQQQQVRTCGPPGAGCPHRPSEGTCPAALGLARRCLGVPRPRSAWKTHSVRLFQDQDSALPLPVPKCPAVNAPWTPITGGHVSSALTSGREPPRTSPMGTPATRTVSFRSQCCSHSHFTDEDSGGTELTRQSWVCAPGRFRRLGSPILPWFEDCCFFDSSFWSKHIIGLLLYASQGQGAGDTVSPLKSSLNVVLRPSEAILNRSSPCENLCKQLDLGHLLQRRARGEQRGTRAWGWADLGVRASCPRTSFVTQGCPFLTLLRRGG